MEIKVLLADDHKIFNQGLRSLLERQTGMTVAAEAQDGLSAVNLALQHSPQLVFMDISMPVMNGLAAMKKILARLPDTKVVILSMHSDKRFVLGALKAGAKGYLVKESAFEEVLQCIETVLEGRTFLSRTVTDLVVQDYIQTAPAQEDSSLAQMSSREREVLQLLVEGKTTKEIAGLLKVSAKTIEAHRKHIMDKLGIYNLPELTRYAIREGIISL